MTDKQPEALRLADWLDHMMNGTLNYNSVPKAAAELRRLHALNAGLLEALKTVTKHLDVGSRNTSDLEAIRVAEKVIAKATGGAPCL